MYNRYVERCFCDCVKSFKGKNLEQKEGECLDHCAEKFGKFTQRVGKRFQEQQAMMNVAPGS